MYIDNENFDKWMEKLSKKLTEIGQGLKSLINTDQVLEENERLLDNQDYYCPLNHKAVSPTF